ncbi:protein ACCELERATED CELL DEATH 6-like isoform X4 [Oryza glaberrima]|uniref:protein ACCELERATED CELL DEATH 6-like isoform X4 n=1 Tax=Oryza glaberrima TaxID=4538 RepID=UPI00224C493A|nr:protein ACCELERATED CELL DEATH 6-like isoform X4 [Oryza glaberrima]
MKPPRPARPFSQRQILKLAADRDIRVGSPARRRRSPVKMMVVGTAATSNALGESSMDKCVPEAKVTNDTGLEGSKDKAGSRTTSAAMAPEWLKATMSGDATSIHDMASQDPNVLLITTAAGNTCLHISCAQGHEEFCKAVVALNPSVLAAVNADNETPLITAAKRGGRASLSIASLLLKLCQCHQLSKAITQKDKKGCNALHHAIRSGDSKLALELIKAEPALSRVSNNDEESPLFIAAVRNLTDVVGKLLEISDAAHGGSGKQNALHAAVRNGNPDIAKRIMEVHPWMAREEIGDDKPAATPTWRAVNDGKIDVVTVLLKYDPSLGYLMNREGSSLLCTAGRNGHVAVARELLKHCPDTPYCSETGWTCLHAAAYSDRIEFVRFVLGSEQLRHLVNIQDKYGRTALHLAAEKLNSRIISALLLHQGIDVTLLNNDGQTATSVLTEALASRKDDDIDHIWSPSSPLRFSIVIILLSWTSY